MVIYTRTGDKGQTFLFNGQRVSKSDLRVEAYGAIDELNSVIGVVIAETQSAKRKAQNYNLKLKTDLVQIQKDLFEIGSALASKEKSNLNYLSNRVKTFENEIDEMTEEMPALSNFILPCGGLTGAMLHFARTVCRRAERKIVKLKELEKIDDNIIMYVNRLSDLLFTMARFVNYKEKKKEILWSK